MADKYCSEKESDQEFDPIGSFLSEWTDPEDEEEDFRSDFFQGLSGRRRKAALVLMSIWLFTIALHLVSWGYWIVIILTVLVGIKALTFLVAKPEISPQPLAESSLRDAPFVSLAVAAKNEEAVIANLIAIIYCVFVPIKGRALFQLYLNVLNFLTKF